MSLATLRAVALFGPQAGDIATRLYRLEARFLPVVVPAQARLQDALAGLLPLGFLGAIFTGPSTKEAFALVPNHHPAALRDLAVDAVTVGAGLTGTHTLEDALLNTLERAAYRGVGANAVVLGAGAAAMGCVALARAGFSTLTFAAPDRPTAERYARAVGAGVAAHALSLDDARLEDALGRADLIVHAQDGVRLEPGWLQPFHTLLELAAQTPAALALERAGGQVIPHTRFAAERFAAQLEYASGHRFDPQELEAI